MGQRARQAAAGFNVAEQLRLFRQVVEAAVES
jgi:hypothetical protein